MDAIQYFVQHAVSVVKITHSDASKPYCFGKLVTWPDFEQLDSHDSVYISRKVARWSKRSIGVLFVPPNLAQQDLLVGQYILADLAKSSKGLVAQAILPPSWAMPVVQFFKLCSQPNPGLPGLQKNSTSQTNSTNSTNPTNQTNQTNQTTQTKHLVSLRDSLVVHHHGIQLDALFHALMVLFDDWSSILSMMQVDCLSEWTSFDLVDQTSKDYYDLIVADPCEFVCLMAVWCQDAQLIQHAADKLMQLVQTHNVTLTDQAKLFVQQSAKHVRHCARMLRQY